MAPADAVKYQEFHRTCHHRRLEAVKGWMEEAGARLPIFLTHFNTLTGKSQVEAGEFHRTALIADMAVFLGSDDSGNCLCPESFQQGEPYAGAFVLSAESVFV